LTQALLKSLPTILDLSEPLASEISQFVKKGVVEDESVATVLSNVIKCLETRDLAGPGPEV
jgi:hypothetical protein